MHWFLWAAPNAHSSGWRRNCSKQCCLFTEAQWLSTGSPTNRSVSFKWAQMQWDKTRVLHSATVSSAYHQSDFGQSSFSKSLFPIGTMREIHRLVELWCENKWYIHNTWVQCLRPKEHSVSILYLIIELHILLGWPGQCEKLWEVRDKETSPTFLPHAEVSPKGKGNYDGFKSLGGTEGNCYISCLIHAPGHWIFFLPLFV